MNNISNPFISSFSQSIRCYSAPLQLNKAFARRTLNLPAELKLILLGFIFNNDDLYGAKKPKLLVRQQTQMLERRASLINSFLNFHLESEIKPEDGKSQFKELLLKSFWPDQYRREVLTLHPELRKAMLHEAESYIDLAEKLKNLLWILPSLRGKDEHARALKIIKDYLVTEDKDPSFISRLMTGITQKWETWPEELMQEVCNIIAEYEPYITDQIFLEVLRNLPLWFSKLQEPELACEVFFRGIDKFASNREEIDLALASFMQNWISLENIWLLECFDKVNVRLEQHQLSQQDPDENFDRLLISLLDNSQRFPYGEIRQQKINKWRNVVYERLQAKEMSDPVYEPLLATFVRYISVMPDNWQLNIVEKAEHYLKAFDKIPYLLLKRLARSYSEIDPSKTIYKTTGRSLQLEVLNLVLEYLDIQRTSTEVFDSLVGTLEKYCSYNDEKQLISAKRAMFYEEKFSQTYFQNLG